MNKIKTILRSVREYKKPSLLAPLFIAFEVILECILPLIMAKLIDSMGAADIRTIVIYGAEMLGISFLSLFCGVFSGINGAKAGCGLASNLRKDLFYRVQDFSFGDIDRFSTSSLVTRMTTDVTHVKMAYSMFIRIAVRCPLMLIFSTAMSFSINARMALIFVAIIPILGLGLGLIVAKAFPTFRRIFKKYDALNNSVQENVAGIRVVKSFVREEHEKEKFHKASDDVRADFTKAERIVALNGPVMMICIYAAMMLVSFIGAKLITSSGGTALTTGQLSSLINYGMQILMSMMMFSMIFVVTSLSIEAVNRISEVLNYESTLKNPENGKMEVEDGSISFSGVSFKYSKDSDVNALSDIDLEIPSGATVGIIGGTGSSKTTLIQLISRLYDTTEGSVKVGGTDVREYDLKALRDEVAVVLQKNVLFSGTIKDNIRYGKKDATDEEIESVCRLAQADEFIQAMPEKYDTFIEQGGTNVSGGQKQRLCIARALIKKPKVLILDDSTSAVDTRTDALIRRAFAKEIPNTTKIIIAQRISSVQDADFIIVMDGGRIVEKGTHEELLANNGIYREVYDSQTKSKEEN